MSCSVVVCPSENQLVANAVCMHVCTFVMHAVLQSKFVHLCCIQLRTHKMAGRIVRHSIARVEDERSNGRSESAGGGTHSAREEKSGCPVDHKRPLVESNRVSR
jgi:hypothetical protein